MIRIPQLITERARLLEQAGIDQGRAEVELILCHLLELDRLNLYMHGDNFISDELLALLDDIITRRVTRYPLQYILEEAWFYGRRFFVSPAVMVPTPETELLCETAMRFVQQAKLSCPRILDLGVGSGVIAVTMASELDDCSILALDTSVKALEVARKNAAEHNVTDKIEFRQSDFFASVTEKEVFDLVLSNPPYISEGEYSTLPPEVLADPKISLVAGQEGLDAIAVIVNEVPRFLAKGGRVIFEIGYNQSNKVIEMTESDDRFDSLVAIKDLNDIDRVIILSCK